MYANILQGPKGGVLAGKTVMPRFPVSASELERLLGFSVVRAFPCQEASGTLFDIKNTAQGLGASGSPTYRKRCTNLMEFGAYSPGSGINGFSMSGAGFFPGTASFLMACFAEYEGGTKNSPVIVWGCIDSADGSPFLRLHFTDATYANYRWQGIDSAPANHVIDPLSAVKAPTDQIPRAFAVMYDAGTSLFYYFVSGALYATLSAAGWAGSGALAASPSIFLGNWPGVAGSDANIRYAFMAHGASLDNQGVNLNKIMNRLGWL